MYEPRENNVKEVVMKKHIILLLFVVTIMVLCLCGCDSGNEIPCLSDGGLGSWKKTGESSYEYSISKHSKEKIYTKAAGQTGNDRSEKMLLALMYIAELDPEFAGIEGLTMGSIGSSQQGLSLSIDLSSASTKIIAGSKEYEMVFESYKDIFFPIKLIISEKR